MRAAIIAAIVAIAVTIPTTVVASHRFSDVPNDHPFHDEIGWMADAGISEGFDDGTFRPGRSVSRQAMSAFMYRLSGKGDVAPSVNADTLRGVGAGEFQRRVDGSCGEGSFVTGVGVDGSVECASLRLDVHVESYAASGGSYVQCPPGFGYVATGGGFSSDVTDAHAYKSQPVESSIDQGWTSRLAGGSWGSAFVVCVRLAPDG